MKRKIILFLTIILFIGLFIIINQKSQSELTEIKVAEVTHSVFYAPLYVAVENNYFENHGIKIDLILTPGADKVSAAVLSGDVNVGFCGPESSIYIYNGGEEDYIINFAGLTKRDGQFLVSREKSIDFSVEDLKGKEILVGRKGGMPAINFENGLNKNGLSDKEVSLNTSVEFAGLSGAFISGIGDYVNLFEPNATKIEQEGLGYVVTSIGKLSGEVPYTAFNAKKSYLENNETVLKNFTLAINDGLKFVQENSSEEIAKAILPQFPDTSLNDLTSMIKRYKDADSWFNSPYIPEKSYNNLTQMLEEFNLISTKPEYTRLVNNLYE